MRIYEYQEDQMSQWWDLRDLREKLFIKRDAFEIRRSRRKKRRRKGRIKKRGKGGRGEEKENGGRKQVCTLLGIITRSLIME